TLAVVDPRVPTIKIARSRELPIAFAVIVVSELGRAPIAQGKAGCIGVDARAPFFADGDAHVAALGHVEAIKPLLFGCDARLCRVDLEILMFVLEAREPECGRACGQTEGDAFGT